MVDSTDIREGLEAYLEGLRRDECYRVERVLKESPAEKTSVVYFKGVNGAEQGPFVRKEIRRGVGLGSVYLELYRQRRIGRRFKYLPAIYDCFEMGDVLVVVMEHVEGSTLRQLVGGTDAADRPRLAKRVFPALLDAVSELHSALDSPVVHRDLTPANIVCSDADPAILTIIDLGIARTYKEDADTDTAHFGTRPYAPPEQYGFGQTDVRSDVYALGLVLFFCLTGRDATASDRSGGYGAPGVPGQVSAVIAKAASLDPEDRYPDASGLRDALARAWDGTREGRDGAAGDGARRVRRPAERRPSEDMPAAGSGAKARSQRNNLSSDRPSRNAAVAADRPGGPSSPRRSRADDVRPKNGRDALPSDAGIVPQTPHVVFSHVPEKLGKAWNVLIAAVYLFFVAVLVACVVDPTEATASFPLWFRVYTFLIRMNLDLALIAWLAWDKRRLERRYPEVRRTWGWWLLRCVAVFFANEIVFSAIRHAALG